MEARQPMRCVLTTEIPVSRVAVFAEMAWMERRPELGLLCRTAREHGNRITTAVVQSALPPDWAQERMTALDTACAPPAPWRPGSLR